MIDLSDKIAVVTGAAQGIGLAIAETLAQQGAHMVIADIQEEKAEAVAKEIGANTGQQAIAVKVDVVDSASTKSMIDRAMDGFGRVDILVNNAGVLRDNQLVRVKDGELVKQMPEEDFDLVVAVNLKGVFNCTQAVAPYMIKQGGGVILNATSVVGLDGNFGQTNYVAAKAGVVGMTKVWARELGRSNIRVNAVAPGMILTEMLLSMPENAAEYG